MHKRGLARLFVYFHNRSRDRPQQAAPPFAIVDRAFRLLTHPIDSTNDFGYLSSRPSYTLRYASLTLTRISAQQFSLFLASPGPSIRNRIFIYPPASRDFTMAMRPASRAPAGSTAWCADERSSALDITRSEVEEFSYSARNEVEWLNEHMADIFSENQMYVSGASNMPFAR